MKNVLVICLLIISFTSCKKAIDKVKENAVIDIMVTGQWYVAKYLKASTDVTADFSGYKFQFYENRTVNAFKNSVVEKTGTWDGNANDLTITSQFTNATYPLNLLNGTFKWTDSGDNFVVANATINGEYRWLRLQR